MLKRISGLAGSLYFGVALFFSLLFFKERTVFLDISFHLFEILRGNSIAIQAGRIGAFFTQLFPLFGSRAGLPLTTVAQLYSASFVLYQALTFFLLLFVVRNTRMALAWLLFLTLMTTHTFFWIQSEMPQGAAYMFLLFGLVDNRLQEGKPAVPLVGTLLLLFTAFTHPLLLFPFLFITGFLVLSHPQHKRWLAGLGAVGLSLFVVKSTLMGNAYERSAMGGLKNIFTRFPHYLGLQSNKNFVHYLLRDYHFLLIGLAAILAFYARQRQWLKALWTTGFFFGYAFVVNISCPDGGDQFYLENQHLILAIIIGFPLAFDILPNLQKPLPALFLSAVLLACLFREYRTHDFYAQRLQWNRNLLQKTALLPQKKLVVSVAAAPKDTLLMTWGSSFELWLLSTMETGESRSLIIEERPGEFDWALPSQKGLITKWGTPEYKDLNPHYFVFKDTSAYGKYPQ